MVYRRRIHSIGDHKPGSNLHRQCSAPLLEYWQCSGSIILEYFARRKNLGPRGPTAPATHARACGPQGPARGPAAARHHILC